MVCATSVTARSRAIANSEKHTSRHEESAAPATVFAHAPLQGSRQFAEQR